MSDPLHAVISGAGVAGLTTAVALSRAGLRVTVLERGTLIEDTGAGIQLSPNATGRLRQLGLLDRVAKFASAPENLRIRNFADGRDLARLPLGPISEFRWGAPCLVIHRADLMRCLVEACAAEPAISLRTGMTTTGFAVGNHGVEVGARRGEEIIRLRGDVLLGADGLKSVLRERFGLGLTDAPVTSGRSAWRALVRSADAPTASRNLETGLWLGPQAHLVHYPVRHGEFINVVAIAEDAWGEAARNGEAGEDLWAMAGEAQEISPAFAKWHVEARQLVGSVREWRRWPLFDRNPVPRWRMDRIALLGDAAHPMLPFYAQGAAQAIEDATALGDAFARHGAEVNAALEDYERARTARAGAVVIASRKQGAIYHMRGPLAMARNLVMRNLGANRMLGRLDWLYNYAP